MPHVFWAEESKTVSNLKSDLISYDNVPTISQCATEGQSSLISLHRLSTTRDENFWRLVGYLINMRKHEDNDFVAQHIMYYMSIVFHCCQIYACVKRQLVASPSQICLFPPTWEVWKAINMSLMHRKL